MSGPRGSVALAQAVTRLRDAGIEDPGRDARRLLAYVMEVAPGRLTLVLQDALSTAQITHFDALIARRTAREPVSHLTGQRLFYGRNFRVTPDVLDPRPETETLIEAALAQPFGSVLDMGTGSGCILLTLLAERPFAVGLGSDLSEPALQVAAGNARALDLGARCDFRAGSWYGALKPGDGPFDLIVSNPPYIALNEMQGLSPEVRDHEPRMALTDEADGLNAYRAICAGAAPHLAAGGRLVVEIGPTQGQAVADLMRAAGLRDARVIPDLDRRDRVVLADKSAQTG